MIIEKIIKKFRNSFYRTFKIWNTIHNLFETIYTNTQKSKGHKYTYLIEYG